MSKYIDSEAFFKVINTLPYKDTSYPDASAYNGAISDVADMLTHFPAADVEEVKHGRWLMTDAYPHRVYCSECYATLIPNVEWFKTYNIASNYCPNCGSRMDLDGDTE